MSATVRDSARGRRNGALPRDDLLVSPTGSRSTPRIRTPVNQVGSSTPPAPDPLRRLHQFPRVFHLRSCQRRNEPCGILSPAPPFRGHLSGEGGMARHGHYPSRQLVGVFGLRDLDRKSTRLNSSHLGISYAVFCLKKKKK